MGGCEREDHRPCDPLPRRPVFEAPHHCDPSERTLREHLGGHHGEWTERLKHACSFAPRWASAIRTRVSNLTENLVGDTVGDDVLEHPKTVSVDLETILHHVRAVVRGSQRALVVADLPFGAQGHQRRAGRCLRRRPRGVPLGPRAAHRRALSITTIRIGVGPDNVRQVLVLHDTLGLVAGPPHCSASRYVDLATTVVDAVTAYCADVEHGSASADESGHHG